VGRVAAPLANAELLELGLSGQAGKAVEGHAAFARKELAELDAIIARHEESRNARLLTKLGLDIDEQTRELGEHLTREQREYCAAAVRLEQSLVTRSGVSTVCNLRCSRRRSGSHHLSSWSSPVCCRRV
jgi:hypothetical protein